MDQQLLNYHTLIFGNWVDDNSVKYDFHYIAEGMEGKVIVDDGGTSNERRYSITKDGDSVFLTIGEIVYEINDLTEATLKGKGPSPEWSEFYLNRIQQRPVPAEVK